MKYPQKLVYYAENKVYNLRMYIWQRKKWPRLTWAENITAKISRIQIDRGQLLGRLAPVSAESGENISLENLMDDVIRSSEIEGVILPADQVRASLCRHLGVATKGSPAGTKDTDGIVEVTLDALQKCDAQLTRDRLFGWHAALFPTGRSGLQKITVGQWRTPESDPMQIISGVYGKQEIYFEAPPASMVPEEMERFLTWFNSDEPMDTIMKGAIAHFWFVVIHPFEDGNGRIGRALSDMILARDDKISSGLVSKHVGFRPYSMSARIMSDQRLYYGELEKASRSKNMEITSWIIWFAETFGQAVKEGHKAVDRVLYKATVWDQIMNCDERKLNARQEKILNLLLEDFKGNLTSTKWAKISHCSQDTAARDIHDLITRGVLVKGPNGGRSTHYLLADKYRLKSLSLAYQE